MRVRFPPGAYCGKEGPNESWEDALSPAVRGDPAQLGKFLIAQGKRNPSAAGEISYRPCIEYGGSNADGLFE